MLTHDALGALVGARRPTITLAVRELTDRGAIVRQDQGWLLVEPPPAGPAMPSTSRDARWFTTTIRGGPLVKGAAGYAQC